MGAPNPNEPSLWASDTKEPALRAPDFKKSALRAHLLADPTLGTSPPAKPVFVSPSS